MSFLYRHRNLLFGLGVGLIVLLSFAYGLAVAVYEVFPYPLLKSFQDRLEHRVRFGSNLTDLGEEVFRSECAGCHGAAGTGGWAPDLTGRLRHATDERALVQVIRKGIDGTAMTGAIHLSEREVRGLVAYIGELRESTDSRGDVRLAGNAAEGERLLRELACSHCHSIAGKGGRLGPDLTEIGGRRSVDYIRRSIMEPNADIPPGYRVAGAVTLSGDTVRGFVLNEDRYSVEILDTEQRLRSIRKDSLSGLSLDERSLMPAYTQLDEGDLDDLVAFLASRGWGSGGDADGVDASAESRDSPPADESARSGLVPFSRLVNAAAEPQNWLTYSGSYSGQRFSSLREITRDNVDRLKVEWVYQLETLSEIETTPLVVDGTMYITEPGGGVTALDAETGRPFWTYVRSVPEGIPLCCGNHNRGAAILDDRLFVGTLDAHLVALDVRTGDPLWDVEVADYREAYSKTGAPLAVKDMIVTGVAGGEFGIRGFLDAYDAETGERRWRFYTVPAPGEPGSETWEEGEAWRTGGGPTWLTGSYDPDLDLIYWGVGNPAPSFESEMRGGDNLYTNAVVALHAETGELEWYFQFMPHDLHDWDANQIPVLADPELDGQPRKLMLWANRNGFYYVLDRATGEFLDARQFAQQTWADGLDDDGRPIVRPASVPTPEGVDVAPAGVGATNWWSPAYNPSTRLLYVTTIDAVGRYFSSKRDTGYEAGRTFRGSIHVALGGAGEYSAAVRALDAVTGARVWEYPIRVVAPIESLRIRYPVLSTAGLLTTAGGLVFGGTGSGYFFALDAASGEELWRLNLGGGVHTAPISYRAGGSQRITVAAGTGIYTFSLVR